MCVRPEQQVWLYFRCVFERTKVTRVLGYAVRCTTKDKYARLPFFLLNTTDLI